MITDRQLLLSNAQAITTTTVSTNTIDLLVARDIGIGDDMELFVRVVTAFAGGTSLQVSYITSPNADLSSPNTIVSTPAIPLASLTAGSEWLRIRVPVISQPAQVARYVGLAYTVVGTMSAGAVTAGIAMDREASAFYASGLNTSGY